MTLRTLDESLSYLKPKGLTNCVRQKPGTSGRRLFKVLGHACGSIRYQAVA